MSKEFDIFRDSPLRYLGYCNEVGEAFRPLIHRHLVRTSYLLATAYVCADAIDKSVKEYQRGESAKQIAIVTGDVFSWQIVASVIIPGATINRITWLTGYLLRKTYARKVFKKIVPTAMGLCSIPIIIGPIDKFTDGLMDATYRKWFY
ncbi:mitochondrial fission process protein 1 [Anastrepha obliqua]|uniref:mitochondrial fission process protein 1 n=1 Tax=Anastrepha obliqua TaxID=95512 RepID=UPI00240A1702|nr:mitochondrial fission process protein 1 [Anastrepha obliqua]